MRGDRLKELRKAKKLSQEKLAEMAGMSREQVNRYENGKSIPDFITIIKIADALNASIDYLVGRSDVSFIQSDPNPSPAQIQAVPDPAPAPVKIPRTHFPQEAEDTPEDPPFSAEQISFLDDRLDRLKDEIVSAIQEDISSLSVKKHG